MDTLGVKTVTTHGTPVQLSSTVKKCDKIAIQALKTLGASGTAPTNNAGAIYLMKGNVAKDATGTAVLAVVQPGDGLFTLQASVKLGFDLSTFYLDSDTDGDGALITFE